MDLVLIHAPYGGQQARKGAWKALVEAKEAGKIRSLGISSTSTAMNGNLDMLTYPQTTVSIILMN